MAGNNGGYGFNDGWMQGDKPVRFSKSTLVAFMLQVYILAYSLSTCIRLECG